MRPFRTLLAALVALLGMLGSTLPVAADDPGKHPEAPPELAALDFLIGEWDLTTSFAQADGTRREEKATLVGRWALGGMAIVVEETHPYPDGVGGFFAGLVIYTVHPESRKIVGAANNTLGNRKHYEVAVTDDEILIVQTGELFGGRKGFNRHVIHDRDADRYALRLDACPESGENCTEGSYSYVATRRPTTDP